MNELQQWPATLTPGTRAVLFLIGMAALGYWLYGRDGTLQAILPFPQADLSHRFAVVR